jgi:Zn-dependent protease with chaperone function
MSLLSYICSSILLSWMGLAAYGLLRLLKPSVTARRGMLWLVLAVSLILPLTPPFTQTTYRHISVQEDANGRLQATLHSPVPVGASNVHDFCHCAQPEASDMILYQTSRVYDFLLRNQYVLLLLLTGTGFLLTLRMFVQLGRLLWRTRRHRAEWIDLDGRRVRMVREVPGISAASLRLFGKYIFWNAALDALAPEEQVAVLLHEYSHLRQFNSWEKMFLAVLQLIWWVNPAFYFISKELELLSEYTADAYAVAQTGTRKHYASLLLRMKSSETFAPLQFFKSSRLRRRIELVLQTTPLPRMSLGPAIVLWILLMLPGELLTKRIVQDQLQDIEVYEFLTECNQVTGQLEFCRKCTYEVYENCYREEPEVPCEPASLQVKP